MKSIAGAMKAQVAPVMELKEVSLLGPMLALYAVPSWQGQMNLQVLQ